MFYPSMKNPSEGKSTDSITPDTVLNRRRKIKREKRGKVYVIRKERN